ncbi:hypothetical protein K8Q96_02070 [Candidatus Nomurabacteria bacterium]|nr:hypothetical protein [Candidatus Nomurabacteria bacterium]
MNSNFEGSVNSIPSPQERKQRVIEGLATDNIEIILDRYIISIRREMLEFLPNDFQDAPEKYLEYIFSHGQVYKESSEKYKEQTKLVVFPEGEEMVSKMMEPSKTADTRNEYVVLVSAYEEDLPTAKPIGMIIAKDIQDPSYLLMRKVAGVSGRDIEQQITVSGKYTDEQIQGFMKVISDKNKELAERFRSKLGIDKKWGIKDLMIDYDEETLEIKAVVPIDWERVSIYNPESPKAVE